MHDLSVEQVGDRGKTDVGVRPYVHGARNALRETYRPDVIEEDEWSDHAAFGRRQDASDLEAAEVVPVRFNDVVDDGHYLRSCHCHLLG
jgi:hypothetical protein